MVCFTGAPSHVDSELLLTKGEFNLHMENTRKMIKFFLDSKLLALHLI